MKYRVRIQIFSLANTTPPPPPSRIVAAHIDIMILYTPSKILSVSAGDDNANTNVLYAHAVVIVIIVRPLASKILLLYRYFEVQAVGCHRPCVLSYRTYL